MKLGIIIVVVLIALVFVSGCEVSEYLGIDMGNFSLDAEDNESESKEMNHAPVIEEINLK